MACHSLARPKKLSPEGVRPSPFVPAEAPARTLLPRPVTLARSAAVCGGAAADTEYRPSEGMVMGTRMVWLEPAVTDTVVCPIRWGPEPSSASRSTVTAAAKSLVLVTMALTSLVSPGVPWTEKSCPHWPMTTLFGSSVGAASETSLPMSSAFALASDLNWSNEP